MLYRTTTITAPTSLPITVDELRLQARVGFPGESDPFDGAEDGFLERLIEAAVDELDFPRGSLGRSLMPRTARLLVDSTPSETILLPGPPVTEILEVKYYDTNGDEQEITADDYRVDLADTGWPARIWRDTEWPEMQSRPGRMWIDYQAGYADAASIPAVIRHSLMVMAATKYRDREGSVVGTILAEHQHFKRALDNWTVRCAAEVSS